MKKEKNDFFKRKMFGYIGDGIIVKKEKNFFYENIFLFGFDNRNLIQKIDIFFEQRKEEEEEEKKVFTLFNFIEEEKIHEEETTAVAAISEEEEEYYLDEYDDNEDYDYYSRSTKGKKNWTTVNNK